MVTKQQRNIDMKDIVSKEWKYQGKLDRIEWRRCKKCNLFFDGKWANTEAIAKYKGLGVDTKEYCCMCIYREAL